MPSQPSAPLTDAKPISRRRFLKTSVLVTVGAGVVVCGGGAFAATYQPPIATPSTSFGDSKMENRVLVAYASKAGSTAEIATRMGETIAKTGAAVDVLPVDKVKDVSIYRSVVLGSAIRMGRPLPAAMDFVTKNQAALAKTTFSAFVVCLTLKDDTPENRATVNAYLDPVRALVKPASEGFFAGVMNGSKIDFISRMIMKAMKSPEGDYRNWDVIGMWASAVPMA